MHRSVSPHAVVLGLVLIGASFALATACGGDSSDEAAVRKTVRDSVEAYNRNDTRRFLDLVTDNYIAAVYSPSPPRSLVLEHGLRPSGEPDERLRDMAMPQIAGDRATVEVTVGIGSGWTRTRFSLVKQDGRWLLDDFEALSMSPPSNATVVDLELVDSRYLFAVERGTYPVGPIVFQATNAGGSEHTMFVHRFPDGYRISDIYEASRPASIGAPYVAILGPVKPRSSATWLVEDLPPGRYAFYCYSPERRSGTPQAYLDMTGSFEVR